MKFVVPSIGSITHVNPDVPGVGACSSPTIPSSGKSLAKTSPYQCLDFPIRLADEILVSLLVDLQCVLLIEELLRNPSGLVANVDQGLLAQRRRHQGSFIRAQGKPPNAMRLRKAMVVPTIGSSPEFINRYANSRGSVILSYPPESGHFNRRSNSPDQGDAVMANPLYDQLLGVHSGAQSPFLRLQDGTILSHDAFLRKAAQFAHVLIKAGMSPGDRLAAQIRKSPEALALYAACVQTGIVFLPLNTGYTAEELSYFIEDSGACTVVCDAENAQSLAPVAARFGATLETLNADGTGTLAATAKAMPTDHPIADRTEEDLAALLYTSGTTGRSKGAMLSQGNLLSNARTLADYWAFTRQDVLLHALPIFHTHGLFVATNVSLA